MAALILFAAALAGGFLFPWWWPAVAAYGTGFWLARKPGYAFLSGFLGTAAAWAGLAAWMDGRNQGLLSGRMAELFHLPGGWALILATGLIGGLMGGMGTWAGQALRAYVKPFSKSLPPKAGAAPATGSETDPDSAGSVKT